MKSSYSTFLSSVAIGQICDALLLTYLSIWALALSNDALAPSLVLSVSSIARSLLFLPAGRICDNHPPIYNDFANSTSCGFWLFRSNRIISTELNKYPNSLGSFRRYRGSLCDFIPSCGHSILRPPRHCKPSKALFNGPKSRCRRLRPSSWIAFRVNGQACYGLTIGPRAVVH